MVAAAGVPTDEASGRIADLVVLTEHPPSTLLGAAAERFDSPAGSATDDRLDLGRSLPGEQARIRESVMRAFEHRPDSTERADRDPPFVARKPAIEDVGVPGS